MHNPATRRYKSTLPLDANLRQSGFSYSTLAKPFRAEKAQDRITAGGTAALGEIVKKSKGFGMCDLFIT
jgi:hypothetical protein